MCLIKLAKMAAFVFLGFSKVRAKRKGTKKKKSICILFFSNPLTRILPPHVYEAFHTLKIMQVSLSDLNNSA